MTATDQPTGGGGVSGGLALTVVTIGVALLIILIGAGYVLVPGFASYTNIRWMLLLAAFLGLASLGQTSMRVARQHRHVYPYVIGFSQHPVSGPVQLGRAISSRMRDRAGRRSGHRDFNGILSFRLQGQALILTLGVGFAVVGGSQILTSIGSAYAGNVLGELPEWLRDVSSIAGTTFGIAIPPIVLIWMFVAGVVIMVMLKTPFGRSFYAVGGNRRAASRF